MPDQCRVEVIDGVPVRVRAAGLLTEADRAALRELIDVCRKVLADQQGPLDVACPTCESAPGALCQTDITRYPGRTRACAPHPARRAAVAGGA